jgi:endonuclease/exonuclease/phosphatase family metal-dependent hydrolase
MRLLSYNIHKGIGGTDRRYDIERVIEVIEAENPDLICLQEVDHNVRRSRYHDQAQLLSRRLNAVAHLRQTTVRLRSGSYGNLIISRWPFHSAHQISLRLGPKKPRGAQLVVVDTPEGPLQLVHWHLGLAEKERHWQVNHLLSHSLFRQSGSMPVIIAGDSNDWRNTLADGPFAQHGFAHVTAPISRYRSFPAYFPMGSLDKAFCRGDVFVRAARVVRSAMAKRASDHLPLVVDFHLSQEHLTAATNGHAAHSDAPGHAHSPAHGHGHSHGH